MFEFKNFLLGKAKIPVQAGVVLCNIGQALFKRLGVAVTSDEVVDIVIGFDVEVVAPGAFVRISVWVSFFYVRSDKRLKRTKGACDVVIGSAGDLGTGIRKFCFFCVVNLN